MEKDEALTNDDTFEIDSEILPDFIADTEEQISSVEENFLLLSQNGFNQEIVNTAYRNVHSIKGNCGFVHLYKMQDLCHTMETIMGGMRDKFIDVNNQNISFLLDYLDIIKIKVDELSKGGNGNIRTLDELVEKAQNKFPAIFGIEVKEPVVEPEKIQTESIELEGLEFFPPNEEQKSEPIKTEKAEPQHKKEEQGFNLLAEVKKTLEAKNGTPKKEEQKSSLLAEVKKTLEAKNETPKKEEQKIDLPTETKKAPEPETPKKEEQTVDLPTETKKTAGTETETPKKQEQKVDSAPKTEEAAEQTKEPAKAHKPSSAAIKNVAEMNEEINKIIVSDDMRQSFAADSNEQLSIIEEDFLFLEQKGFDLEKIDDAYRNIHSFKGNCSFMVMEDLKTVSHTMETVMQFVRDKKIPVDNKLISFLLSFLDVLRNGINVFEKGGNIAIPNAEEYRKKAAQIFPECFGDVLEQTKAKKAAPEVKKEKPADEKVFYEEVIAAKMAQPAANIPSVQIRQDVRVDMKKLENIINLAGELSIAESMVTRNPAIASIASETLSRSIHQLRRITNDLQDATMVLRMVPLSGLYKKMARLVHDLSNHVGKKINFLTNGEDTEVDKSIAELVNDPLVHIIRNACDHGIEHPKERIAAGKDEIGTITLSSEHKSGAVWISVKDDGGGLNREKILKKALEQKIISPDDQLTDDEIWRLIMLPGFSTASIVSDISGRGVGMDVVQKNIEELKGHIYIKTTEGQGTEFIIRIPLTLAIIDGMIIKVVNSLYIIPTLTIKQNLRFDKNLITYSPEGEEILKFQDKLVPIVRVGNLFQKDYKEMPEDGIIIVVESDDNYIALFADEIVGQQQIVIKGLSDYVSKARGTSSCTILGDGSIALILDINTLSEMALEKVNLKQKIPVHKNKFNKKA